MSILAWHKNNQSEKTEETVEEDVKKSSYSLFDFLSFLMDNKKDWNKLSDADKKAFSPFMINRGLAMNPLFAGLVSDMQQYTMSSDVPAEVTYRLYHSCLPNKKYYVKWIKSKQESKWNAELIDILTAYFKESKKNVYEYLKVLDESQLKSILELYGKDEKEINKLLKKNDGAKAKTKATRTKKK